MSLEQQIAHNPIVIFGAGGHASVVADAVLAQGSYQVTEVIDPAKADQIFCSVSVKANELGITPTNFIVALGDNRARRDLFLQLKETGWTPAVVQHPAAIVASGVEIAGGTVLFARAVVNSGSTIGENCIINTGSIIEHDCCIGAHAHIAPGACLGGAVRINEGALVGIGSSIIQNVTVGEWSTLGAGGAAIKDVPANATAVGIPAIVKKIRVDRPSVKL